MNGIFDLTNLIDISKFNPYASAYYVTVDGQKYIAKFYANFNDFDNSVSADLNISGLGFTDGNNGYGIVFDLTGSNSNIIFISSKTFDSTISHSLTIEQVENEPINRAYLPTISEAELAAYLDDQSLPDSIYNKFKIVDTSDSDNTQLTALDWIIILGQIITGMNSRMSGMQSTITNLENRIAALETSQG